jgi:hypothetical protein
MIPSVASRIGFVVDRFLDPYGRLLMDRETRVRAVVSNSEFVSAILPLVELVDQDGRDD